MNIYVGVAFNKREVFRSATVPTDETHGETYYHVIGPFLTEAGARYMAEYGRNNPHCVTVEQAERLARSNAGPAALARQFSVELRRELTQEKMFRVNELNKAEPEASICHSHDFTDANQVMLNAFDALGLPDPSEEGMINNDAMINLWNEAWNIAKRASFNPAQIP